MKVINRKISTMQRFFEIVETMPDPICNLLQLHGDRTAGLASNNNGVCVYSYIPTKEELPTFEKQIKQYIFKR